MLGESTKHGFIGRMDWPNGAFGVCSGPVLSQFDIRCPPFHDGKNPLHQLVLDVVLDEERAFALLDLFGVVGLQVCVVPDCAQCPVADKCLQLLVGQVGDLVRLLDRSAGRVAERGDADVAGELPCGLEALEADGAARPRRTATSLVVAVPPWRERW